MSPFSQLSGAQTKRTATASVGRLVKYAGTAESFLKVLFYIFQLDVIVSVTVLLASPSVSRPPICFDDRCTGWPSLLDSS